MKNLLVTMLFLLCFGLKGQDCSPYHKVNNWQGNDDVEFTAAWVACFHTHGMAFSAGWNEWSIGTQLMGPGHKNTAYAYIDYTVTQNRVKLFMGPAVRLNNVPSLLVGRVGADIKITKPIWATTSIIQVSPGLNYMNAGIKIRI